MKIFELHNLSSPYHVLTVDKYLEIILIAQEMKEVQVFA